MRSLKTPLILLGLMAIASLPLAGCGDQQPPIVRVGVNVVEKSAFTGSWYMHRTVIEMEYESAGLDFVGNNAGDRTGGFLGFSIPRIRWVIDENFLYAYRDYEIVGDPNDPYRVEGDENPDYLGQPIAAFQIESHFDIRREYNPVTGEERNIVVENTTDRHWYERQFMRVNWSRNLLTSYFGNSANLSEIFGTVRREPSEIFVQPNSEFPREWHPQFHFMSCASAEDESESCRANDRDWASDYDPGTLYSMSFVTQEILSPGTINIPGWGNVPYCGEASRGLPECASTAIWIRTSFLRVSDRREYEALGWTHDRFNRAGYFALDRTTYDQSQFAGDPSRGITDFTNQSTNRHNIWQNWFRRDGSGEIERDERGRPVTIPYAERQTRPVIWYNSRELPAHLVKPSFEVITQWNEPLVWTVRQLRGEALPEFPEVQCQETDPDGDCFCQRHPETGEVLNPTCAGTYMPYETPEQAAARGVINPYRCHVEVPGCRAVPAGDGQPPILSCDADGAEPDWNDPSAAARATDTDFLRWFDAEMVGEECINILRNNTCHVGNQDEWQNLDCQQRGDIRFKLLSFVDQPGTPFLGVAQLRGDPLTGEVITGDANIGGPAMNTQRTRAMEAYDLINGTISVGQFYTGEDIRGYMQALGRVDLPAAPRIDFSVASSQGLNVDPRARQSLENQMSRAMERADVLRGAEGRAATFHHRLFELAGTDLEQRLLANTDTLAMAGMNNLAPGTSPDHVPDEVLEMVSPFRVDAQDALRRGQDLNTRLGLANMMMPNEYTDDSVLWFVNEHRDWPRARVEIELNRRLYRDTQVHEMGHCLGLRHNFSASSDVGNYFDGYYTINERFPVPDPADFDEDGIPGLNVDEQRAFEQAYREAKRLRELAGINQWMTASVMDYTPNWYQRINGAGRHDFMAIAFGYGDIVDIYDNSAGRPVEQITPANTPRTGVRYYHGGETCESDAQCPFNPAGSRAADLLPANMSSGLVQTCRPSPRTAGVSVCSAFDDDAIRLRDAGASGRFVPVEYFFCEDIRSSTRSLPGCAIFDFGDTYREIVRNQMEAYERDYIFSAFRRYRRNFDIGGYVGRLIRYMDPLISIYSNLIYRYATDPEFREVDGPFGFPDQFYATADTMNFLARIMAQAGIGSYQWNSGWERYERISVDPMDRDSQLSIDIGQGRHFNSVYQRGLTGIWRIERIGAIYDSIISMQLMTVRGLGPFYGPDVVFQTNFYDIFPNEIQQIFTGMIADQPEQYMPRVRCAPESVFPRCIDPELVYMDFYRGDCGIGSDATTCRPSPADVTYRDLPVLSGGTRFLLQSYAAIFGLAEFPIYYDTTFQNQMYICIEGQGDCFQPDPDAEEGVDFVRYISRRFGNNFLAWQVDPIEGVATQRSIAFSMVKEASDLDFLIRALRTYRGDLSTEDPPPPPGMDNLTDEQRDQLEAIGYEIPADDSQLQFEIDRLDRRLVSLESFFNYIIFLQRSFGIQFPFLYQRPEI